MNGEERRALLIDDSRFDYLETRGLLLGGETGIERLDWKQQWEGSEAALADGPYELFLVDMHLGSLSGLEVIRALRAAGVSAPVIALTGQATTEIDRACTEAGASDFLVKGQFDRLVLERSIRYAKHQAAVQDELNRLNAALERRAVAENDQARLMRFAVEQSTDGILITPSGPHLAELVVVYVNGCLCEQMDRRPADLLGHDVSRIFDAAGLATLDAPARNGVGARLTMKAEHGAVPMIVTITPLSSGDGVVENFVWTCRRATREVRGSAANALLGLSQEISDTVTSVAGHLERLAPKLETGDQRALLSSASAAADRLIEQVQRLKDQAGGHG